MNADHLAKPTMVEKVIFMSHVQASDPPWTLLQLTSQNSLSAAILLKLANTELHFEEADMEFLLTVFQKLSYTIYDSFIHQNIHIIWSMNVSEELQQAETGIVLQKKDQ